MSERLLRRRWLIVFLCLTALLAGLTLAQQGSSNFDLEGSISKQSKGKLTVDTGQSILFHVAYDDKTSIVRADSSAGSEEDLKVGVKVHVIGDLQDSGEIKAQRIEIEAAPAKSAPPPAPQP
jgi:hypothetical protein